MEFENKGPYPILQEAFYCASREGIVTRLSATRASGKKAESDYR